MLRNSTLLAVLLYCFVTAGVAQSGTEKTTTKGCSCAFSSINQGGFLTGERGSSLLLQTINGVQYKTWFAGVGVGLDFYKTRGIPLFLDIRKNILNKASTPFIYMDGGIHFTWPTEKDKGVNNTQKFNNGLYYDAGLGYKAGLGNTHALLLSVGYSLKKIEEKYVPFQVCPGGCGPTYNEQYNYTLNRLSLKVGWQF
jgi:hypothetical protein